MDLGNNTVPTPFEYHTDVSTTTTTRPGSEGPRAPRVGLRELPDGPCGAVPRSVPEELTARLQRAAEQAAEQTAEWRLTGWLADLPLGSLREAMVAIAVGAGLAAHRGLDFAWQMPLLVLAGISFLLVGGRVLLGAAARARLRADAPGAERADEPGPAPGRDDLEERSVSPQRLGTSLIAAGCVCFVPLFLVAGTPFLVLALSSAAVIAVLLSGLVPFAFRSQAETLARLGMTAAIVGGVVLARGGQLTVDVVIASLQLGLLATVLGSVTNLRDLARDRKVGRKTLVARFGVPLGRFEVSAFCLVPYAMSFAWMFAGAWGAALLPLVALPLAAWIIRDVNLLLPGPLMDSVRPRAAALQLAFGSLLAVGLAL